MLATAVKSLKASSIAFCLVMEVPAYPLFQSGTEIDRLSIFIDSGFNPEQPVPANNQWHSVLILHELSNHEFSLLYEYWIG